jgi:hypothetical protein
MVNNVRRPAYDETFSSWLYRIAVTRSALGYGAFSAALKDLVSRNFKGDFNPKLFGMQLEKDVVDIDYDPQVIQEVIGSWLPSHGIYWEYFLPRSTLVVTYSMRNHYCPECLRGDIATIGFPYWRKAWSNATSAYCLQHKRLLVSLPPGLSTYDRAWKAFKEGAPDVPVTVSLFKQLRDRLAMRIQRWYFRRPGFCTLGLENTQQVRFFFDLTYSLFLKMRTRFEDGGIACVLAREHHGQIHPESLTLSDRIRIGIDVSTCGQRAFALILTGIILGLLPEELIMRFTKMARQSGIPWPKTPFEVGKMAILYAHREEYLELRRVYSSTPVSLVDRCSEFFRGLEHSVHVLRDEFSPQDRKWLETGAPHLRWAGPIEH